MSLMEKIKAMFSGGSPDTADSHAEHDHDHAGNDHSHEPAEPPMPQADIAEKPSTDEPGSSPN